MSWLLGADRRDALERWASTSVANLGDHPVGSLLLSAFLTPDHPLAWPTLAAMALYSADRVLGPARAALACGAAHVVGTLVSEGIVAWRIRTGALPATARHLDDIGPSYIVVCGLTIALIAASWPRRTVALAGFVVLWPYLFTGLTRWDVSAVGHLVSVTLGTAAAGLGYLRSRRRVAPATG